ncbi:hypothetical protein PR002_g180 [Phytophthora rubi]|uniref:WW domain-containing protein n=1 Tax=Phytophthora rubi TaxID=129364 RepID=A0A6A3NTV1_9STRA|nr:hypothetical protein PR002_g180 [Phytophthora rubi]
MKELKKICSEEPNSSFFMCLSTHGARITRGANEGSYVLFSETRLSSEEELVLTAIHERDLAKMIHDIPSKNKFVAVELCQIQEPKDKIVDDAEAIRHRIHEQFLPQLYKQIVQLRLQALLERGIRLPSNEELTEDAVRSNPKLFNLILMESCDVKKEVPVRANERVSNFMLRFRDAFRGAAITPKLDEENGFDQGPRHPLFAKEVLEYVCRSIRDDAVKHNALVHTEYKSRVRTSSIDFGLGEIPATWREALLSVDKPSIMSIAQDISSRDGRDFNSELTRCATWALEQLRVGAITLRQKPRHVLSEHAAATRLQGMYRCRKAREGVRALARSVYAQAIDPTNGMTYVFNTRTGATFWGLPQFAS